MTITGPSGVTPRLSIGFPNWSVTDPGDWDFLLDRARAADRGGIDRLALSDHVVFGENLEAYSDPSIGGREGGRQPTGPDGIWLEPLTLLAVIGSHTSQIRLHTGILLAALRRPIVLAKTAATLDVLSRGRLELGVGVGWQREEYDAAGLRFENRGAALDQTLAVCQALWRDQAASYHGEGLDFDAIHCMPKPVQPNGVPLWVSGTVNRRVLARVVKFGSGWIPWGGDVDTVAESAAQVHESLRAAGRTIEGFEITGFLNRAKNDRGALDLQATMAVVPAMVAAGVTDFRLNVSVPNRLDEATETFREVASAFRASVGRPLPS